MRALSIRQPWAWAILHAGKDIENRDWKPGNPARRFRGSFLIHGRDGRQIQLSTTPPCLVEEVSV
jgi:hypothetical protein